MTNPVAGVPFVVRVGIGTCATIDDATVSGGNIDINATLSLTCCATCISIRDVSVGPLPAGTYTIRLLLAPNSVVIATAPVVVSADVPALDPGLLAMLGITLVVIATIRLRLR